MPCPTGAVRKRMAEVLATPNGLPRPSTLFIAPSVQDSPWSPRMGNWACQQHPQQENVWNDAILDDTGVLVAHGPPRAHLDLIGIGCVFLLDAVWRVRPRLHVFGHVHEGYGQEVLQYTPLQAAYERLVIARIGVWELVLCLW